MGAVIPRPPLPPGPFLIVGLARSGVAAAAALAARGERVVGTDSRVYVTSDGGAHLLSFCGADYTTRLLTEWVPSVLTLEQAVARVTSIPAHAAGMADR